MLFLLLFLLGRTPESSIDTARVTAVKRAQIALHDALIVAVALRHGAVTVITGYTSSRGETDATPCIAADGTNICARLAGGENICASNRHAFGTQLVIDGLGVCTVADRTHRRHSGRIDWYFGTDRSAAITFGKRRRVVAQLP